MELDAEHAAADIGMRKLGNRVGVKLVSPENLRRIMENLAKRSQGAKASRKRPIGKKTAKKKSVKKKKAGKKK
jgi:hypothetical protein